MIIGNLYKTRQSSSNFSYYSTGKKWKIMLSIKEIGGGLHMQRAETHLENKLKNNP